MCIPVCFSGSEDPNFNANKSSCGSIAQKFGSNFGVQLAMATSIAGGLTRVNPKFRR